MSFKFLKVFLLSLFFFVFLGCGGGDSSYSGLKSTLESPPNAQQPSSDKTDTQTTVHNEKPTTPRELRGYTTINQATLSWENSSDDDGLVEAYEVSYRKEGESQWSSESVAYSASVLLDNLTPNTTYELRIRAIDNEGEYSESNIKSITTKTVEEGRAVVLVQGLNDALSKWSPMAKAISKELNASNSGSYVEIGFDIDIDENAKCWNVNFLDTQIDCSKLTDVEYDNKFRSNYNLYAQDRVFGLDRGQFEVVNIDWRFGSNSSSLVNNSIEKYANFAKQRVFVVNFSNNNQLSFDAQGYQLKAAIDDIAKVTGIKEYILIGHYMGGLAARAYIQNETTQDIKKLITINTPHTGGKSLAVLASELYEFYQQQTSWWSSVTNYISSIFSSDSLSDLVTNIKDYSTIGSDTPDDSYDTGNQTVDQALDMKDKIIQGGSERYAALAGAIYRVYSQNSGVNLASDSKALMLLNDNISDKYDTIEVHHLGYSDGTDTLSNYFQGGDGKSYIGSQMGLDALNPYRVLFTSSNRFDIKQYDKEFFDTQKIANDLGTANKIVSTDDYNTLFAFDDNDTNINALSNQDYIDYVLQAIHNKGDEIVIEQAMLKVYNATDFLISRDGIYQLYIKTSKSSDWGDDLIGGSDFSIESYSSQEFKTSKCDTTIDIKATGLGGSPVWIERDLYLSCEEKKDIRVLFPD